MPYEKVGKNEPVCIADEVPFEIPDTWEWIRLGTICDIARGGSPRPIKSYLTDSEDGINWIKISDSDKGGKYINSTKERIIPEGVAKSRMVYAGDFLLTNSMSFGRPYILNVDGCIHDGWLVLSNYQTAYDQDFLFTMLSSSFAYYQFCSVVSGAVVKNLNSDKVSESLFPLPPIQEQKRIVSAINSFEPFVSEYTNCETELNRLNRTFPEKIKKSILQEAVQGKLVPQDPDDEPASVLLERIRTEKEQLIKAGKIKRDKHESIIFRRDNSHYEKLDGIERCIDDEIPFDLPVSWEWVRLGYLLKIESGKPLTSKEMKPGTIPVYGGNGITGYHNDYLVDEETVVIGRVGYYCGSIHVTEPKAWVTDNAFITTYPMGCIDRDYLVFTLRSMNLGQNNNATAQPVVSGKKIYPMLFPLPPLAEQKRIALKLKEILPFCKTI